MTSDIQLQNTVSAKKPGKKKKASNLNARKARAGWWFVAPFIVGFVLIYIPVIMESLNFSFSEYERLLTGGYNTTWVGFQNYQHALFGDASYVPALLSSLQTMALNIPMIVIFSLFMAVVLNQKMVGRSLFRAIFFIPVILSTGLMENIAAGNILEGSMEQGIDTGTGQDTAQNLASAIDLEALFENMKVGQELVMIVSSAINSIYDIVNRSGVQLLIFLAGLQSISPAIYESCQIDGATAWETFWKITFPMISPMILVNAIYTIIDSFTMSDNAIMSYVKNYTGEIATVQGEKAAMYWIYFLIVMAFIGLVGLILKGYVFYQKRDA